jgi:RNA polymerase sigma-70 factor (ECF subfamily)
VRALSPFVRIVVGDENSLSATSISLLERLRLRPDEATWQRFVTLYTPMLSAWLRQQGVQPADADDLTQEVFGTLLRELPHFNHDLRPGAFRRWLRGIVVNRLRYFWRTRRPEPVAGDPSRALALDSLEDPDSDLSRLWDEEHDRHVVRRLLELLAAEFEPTTWSAFRMLVLEGRPTRDVADALGISSNAVRIAKSRVLARFRQEADGLID